MSKDSIMKYFVIVEKRCLEAEISGKYIHRRLIQLIEEGEVSLLSKRVEQGEEVTLDDIIEGVKQEDILCIELIEEVGQKLENNLLE